MAHFGQADIPKAVNGQHYESSAQLLQLGLLRTPAQNPLWRLDAQPDTASRWPLIHALQNRSCSTEISALAARFRPLHPWRYQPHGLRGPAQTLLALNRLDDAQTAFDEMVTQYPHYPHGYAGLAQVAMRREAWPNAVTHWAQSLRYVNGEPAAAMDVGLW